MKRIGWFAAAAAAFMMLSISGLARAESHAKAKTEITDIEHKLIDATSADQVMQYYDKDNIDLYDFHPPLQYEGASAVKADLADFFNSAKDVKGKFVELKVVTDGEMGMARSIQHFTWTGKDGKPGAGTFRVTDVFRKEDGKWKVIHSHVSVPVDPATGKAEMDLKS